MFILLLFTDSRIDFNLNARKKKDIEWWTLFTMTALNLFTNILMLNNFSLIKNNILNNKAFHAFKMTL